MFGILNVQELRATSRHPYALIYGENTEIGVGIGIEEVKGFEFNGIDPDSDPDSDPERIENQRLCLTPREVQVLTGTPWKARNSLTSRMR